MENQVTLSLEEYKELLIENVTLKAKMEALKVKAYKKLEDEIEENLIRNLSKEETINWLNQSKDKVLSKFGPYNWAYTSIAADLCVIDEKELKEMAAVLITRMLDSHLRDFSEQENK